MGVRVGRLQRLCLPLVLAVAAACGSSTTPSLSVSPSSFTVSQAGQSGLSVTVSASGNWTAVADSSALTITAGSSGTNDGTITFNVAANTTGSTQTLHINVTQGSAVATVTVTEPSGSGGGPSLNPSSQSVGSGGQSGLTTAVTASGSWTAASDSSQVTITNGASGSGNGTITYNVAASTSSSTQTFHIIVTASGQTATLTITEAAPGVILSVNPTTQSVGSSGQTGLTAAVMSNVAWTATSNSSALTITGGASGSNNGPVTYNVAANSGPARTLVITISGSGATATVTVSQASGVSSLSLSSGAAGFNANAQSGGVGVISNVNWTATSDSAFLTITSGSSGSNNGTISYNLAVNPNLPTLTGHIMVSAPGVPTQTLTVTQTGLTASLSISNSATCTVDNTSQPLTLQCTMDASASVPLSNIKSFAFHLVAPSEDLEDPANGNATSDKNPTWVNPIAPTCGFPPTSIMLQVTLTVTSTTSASMPITVPFLLNRQNACFGQ